MILKRVERSGTATDGHDLLPSPHLNPNDSPLSLPDSDQDDSTFLVLGFVLTRVFSDPGPLTPEHQQCSFPTEFELAR